MMTIPGTPVIYYGDEQGFTGDGGDRDARQDMMPSLVPSYNDDGLIGTTATTAERAHERAQRFFEIDAAKAAAFVENVREPGSRQRGVPSGEMKVAR